MATMLHAEMATKDFTQEFERCSQDSGMAEEDAKVHLVSVLNDNT